MSEFISVTVTTATAAEAVTIAHALVAERLAGCVNIVPNIRSVYRWEGQVHDEAEVMLTAKTRASLFAALCERVKILHSYSCPCIVAMPISAGDPSWLEWLDQQVSPVEK